jgi:hypothetical protein
VSSGEFLGLLVTVSLLGVLVGAVFTWITALRRDRLAEPSGRRIDAHAQWLSARMTLSRASTSFVAAFRALAAERPDSEYMSLRREEAQRTRSAWWEAMRDLDHAEAMLLVWSGDPTIHERLARFDRVGPEALRNAINGGQAEVDKLTQRFRDADARAAEFVRLAAAGTRTRQSMIRKMLALIANYAASIVDHWSRR